MARKIHEIAGEIEQDWDRMYFGARPYVTAMHFLNTPADRYGVDDGDSIIRYFLANAGTWRGEVARRVKDELRSML